MSWYASSAGPKEIDAEVYAGWVAAGNPKAQAYQPIPDRPSWAAQWDGAQWVLPPEPTIEDRRASMEVSRLQARLALIQVDLWPAVVAYFADPARTEVEKAFFEDAQVWKRLDPTLQAACVAFGMSDEQVDDLFTLAASL